MNIRRSDNTNVKVYSGREICRSIGISARQLGYWRLIGVVSPTVERRGAKTFYRYADADVKVLREVARLTSIGLPVSRAVVLVRSGKSDAVEVAALSGEIG